MLGTKFLQGMAVALMFMGGFLTYAAVQLKLQGMYGPGPGFFPFLIGVGLLVVSALWMLQITLGVDDRSDTELNLDKTGLKRVVYVLLPLIGFAILMPLIGFNLAMFLLLAGLMLGFDRKHIVTKLVLALVLSFGVHFVFEHGLRVPLPYASLHFLRGLGF